MNNNNHQTLAKDKNEFVSSIITNKQGNILILKRKETLRLDPGKYDFCSGHMKEGEVPMQSMYRELREELGLNHDQLLFMDKVGDIDTPHHKLSHTVTHIYHVGINISEEKINEMLRNVEEPEMDGAFFIKDIEELKKIQEETDKFRIEYTKQMRIIMEVMEERINKRKEKGVKECEEK